MQGHLNGFRKHDPSVVKPTSTAQSAQSEVDVVIVGCSPAGLTLAAQLCAFDGPTIRIAEHKSGPLEMGHELKGDSIQQLWGVMDLLPRTNFPAIRLNCAIHSADAGSILIIPWEGSYVARLYIELDELREGERAKDRGVTSEQLVAKAQEIFAPFTFDAAEIACWSAYEIGQRVCDSFDDVAPNGRGEKTPRIFIAGDACHTHSPKTGRGMNVSMADDPSALARDFMDLTENLLFRADSARISKVSNSADLKRLSRHLLDQAPAWKSVA